MHGVQRVSQDQSPARAPKDKRRQALWFEYLKPIPLYWSLALGVAVWVIFFGVWELAAAKGWVNTLFMPPPHQVLSTLYTMIVERGFLYDIGTSIYRIVASFALACAVAIPLGVLMGSFRSVDSFFNPFVSAWRYLPAPAFIPLLLMWFGAGEGSKLALLFIGVIFFLITLIIDHTRARRRSRYFRKRHCRRASEGEARSRRGGDRLLAAAELCRPAGQGARRGWRGAKARSASGLVRGTAGAERLAPG